MQQSPFSSLALVVGMVVANIIQPGKGLNIDPTTLANDKVADYVEKAHDATLVDFFMNIIPKTLGSVENYRELIKLAHN